MMPNHLLPPVSTPTFTTPEAAQAALDEAIAARGAVVHELWDATNVLRDLLAAHDDAATGWAYAHVHGVEQRCWLADYRVNRLRGQLRWRGRGTLTHDHHDHVEAA
jgi:hypothetical protein